MTQTTPPDTVLQIEDLKTSFFTEEGEIRVVNGGGRAPTAGAAHFTEAGVEDLRQSGM